MMNNMHWNVVKNGSNDIVQHSDIIWVEFVFRGQAREVLKFQFSPLRARPGGQRKQANHIPFESSFHKEFDGTNLNFHMLHDIASFMQNTFQCSLQGYRVLINCYFHCGVEGRVYTVQTQRFACTRPLKLGLYNIADNSYFIRFFTH